MLETHFRRSFMAYFDRDENLGAMIKAIRAEGETHPCHSILAKMDSCNDATCQEHHGDDALLVPRTGVDGDELRIIVGDCLELVGANRCAPPDCTLNLRARITPPVTPAIIIDEASPEGVVN